MPTLLLADVDPVIYARLSSEAQKRGVSVDQFAQELLARSIESIPNSNEQPVSSPARDLHDLAGTWSDEDLAEFKDATRHFESVDEDLWK